MTLVLYELGGLDDRRYSQFSWRTRLALAHKGLAAETRPVAVSDKAAIAFSGQDKVPILVDGERIVPDSWAIAEYLEAQYPDRPSLFGGAVGHGLSRFINAFVDRVLIPRLAPLLMVDVVTCIDETDATHIRTQMERVFGTTLEKLAETRAADVAGFRKLLDPVRVSLRGQPFLCGERPAYADYILFSLIQWARIVSPFELLQPADTLGAWRERMLDLHDGLARAEPARAPSDDAPEPRRDA
jgi:glutathione S-transferase